jgi:uncharacterized membrane protein YfcA
MLIWLLMYLGIGSITCLLAGLLRIGGGLVVVPTLDLIMTWQGIP